MLGDEAMIAFAVLDAVATRTWHIFSSHALVHMDSVSNDMTL